MPSWTAQTVCTATALSPDDIADLSVNLPGALSYDGVTGRLKAVFELEAPTLKRATSLALRRATEALPGKPSEVLVQTTDRFAADLKHPAPIDLVSLGEAADLLGVSRARVDQLCKARADFPAPLARVGSGPVWTRASIESYKERAQPLPPGRPRKRAGEFPSASSAVKASTGL